MCGIAGIVRFDDQNADRLTLDAMANSMVHRGPDDAGIYTSGSVGLAHRRLSIIDLSKSGHQPMCNSNGSIWLTFNGEIYNYVELRRQLVLKGYCFDSTSDTEVLLRLFEEYGEKCVNYLNGMFAFAIWDSNTSRLFCARDRLGIKPFYYYSGHDQFVFASEIKAIQQVPGLARTACDQGIADLFFAGAPLGKLTIFADIFQLEPGHCLTIENGVAKAREYWEVRYDYRYDRSLRQVEDELADLLANAVSIHCRSDAPLGCHLSGGLDSSFITASASKFRKELKTFSIRFDGGYPFDETEYARIVSSAVGTRYCELTGKLSSLADLMPTLMWHMDYPPTGGNDVGFTYYLAAKLAAQHVKVSLTGHGGDELFAGYPAQFITTFGRNNVFDTSTQPMQNDYVGRISNLFRREGTAGVFRHLRNRLKMTGQKHRTPSDTWMNLHCGLLPEKNSAFSPSFVKRLGGYDPRQMYLHSFDNAPTDQLLDKCLHHDLRVYLPQLLHKEDRASMSVSLESRVPFLDYRVVEYMATVPPEQKVPTQESKALLRSVARRILPDKITRRKDKVPFLIPIDDWLSGDIGEMAFTLLRSEKCLDRGIFDPDEIRAGRMSAQMQLAAMNLELWFRLFIDRDRTWLDKIQQPKSERLLHSAANI